jgi:CheY-like chemotaxis protein
VAAGTGPEGLRLIVERRPRVALVDLGLPGFGGLELARRVRAALGDATPRLVALTGHTEHEDRDAALAAGFDRHLPKPIDLKTLLEAVA